MGTLFRVFVLKNLHGLEHETALIEYLESRPERCDQLGLEPVPDQSTPWRSWHNRFTADLCETIEIAARTILVKAQNAGVGFRMPQTGSFLSAILILKNRIRTSRL